MFGGGSGFDYEAYQEEMRRKRAEAMKAHLAQQAEVDAISDPAARLEAQRARYKCGDRFVTLEGVPRWPETARSLASLPNNTSKGAGSRGGGGFFSSPNDTVSIVASDVAQRYAPDASLNGKISIFQGDITALEVDAIVNAANESLRGGGGIDGAIHSAAGPLLVNECETYDSCPTGETRITKGYALPAKNVLHTVGPIGGGVQKLRACYESCLALVKERQLRSVAFCCVSTGIFGFPLVKATHIALTVVRQWLAIPENAALIDRIVFCTFRDVECETYERLLPSYFPAPESELPKTPETDPAKFAPDAVDWNEPEPVRGGWGAGGGMSMGGGGGMRF